MISSILHDVLRLRGIAVYGIVAALVFAEDALLLGLVAPGETAAIVGGVAASRGHASVVLVCVCVVVAAVLGDAVGYFVGARFGPRVLQTRFLRHRAARIEQAEHYLLRRGGAAVFFGRFVAFLRTVIPFLAGSTRMRFAKFSAFNIAGGVLWGTGCVVIGFLAGDSYSAIARVIGPSSAVIIVIVVVAAFVAWQIRRHRRDEASDSDPDTKGPAVIDADTDRPQPPPNDKP
jgi:membrane-associated protein